MGLFSSHIDMIRGFVDAKRREGGISEIPCEKEASWPAGGKRNVVLSQDTAVELGHPSRESSSFLVWTDDAEKVNRDTITIIGPDIQQSEGKSLPFGKIVIASVTGFNEENSYDRYRQMEGLRYDLDLKGYMMRAVSQYQREWSRISREAVDGGFSLGTLGSALINKSKELDYLLAAEVIFVTSSPEDVREIGKISGKVSDVINAMNKMLNEMSFDCDTCQFLPVCDEVEDLRKMRNALNK